MQSVFKGTHQQNKYCDMNQMMELRTEIVPKVLLISNSDRDRDTTQRHLWVQLTTNTIRILKLLKIHHRARN